MKKARLLMVWLVVSTVLLAHLYFIRFFYGDACIDRGGRFLSDQLMCEAENGFISFSVGPVFYVISCFLFGAFALVLLRLVDGFLGNRSASDT